MQQNIKTKLGVFDIDGTIFRSSLTVELVNGFIRAGIFPKVAKKEMEVDYLSWMNRQAHYDQFAKKLIEILFKYLPGCKKVDVDLVVDEVVLWQKDRVYRYTRDLIQTLKKQDYTLIAISGSPSYIVQKFAVEMGFDIAYGLPYETVKGMFTGEVLNMNTVEHKELVLKNIIDKYQIDADLSQSVAVGDTDADIPMLQMVGRAIAFNPNNELAVFAKSKNWEIIIERKDVIYNVRKFEFET